MRASILRTITRFAIAIVIVLVLSVLYGFYADTLPEERQNEVLIKAIPFVLRFVAILLAYIMVIVIVAIVLNGRVPPRTHRPIELAIIVGILLAVLALFQGWKLFVYENGFTLLLISVLSFILWSHITPMPARSAKQLPPFSRRARTIAIVAAVIVWGIAAVVISLNIKPQAPYGVAPRVWEMMMTEEERAAMTDEFNTEYSTIRIPVAGLISLLPAAVTFYAAREIVATSERRKVPGAAPSGAVLSH